MTQIDKGDADGWLVIARRARRIDYVRRAKVMLLAAGITAFGIVAVAAAMMITLV